ncbi:MAG: LysR family transcriptional regulator [Oscillospiraceae bacterium]|nr:LysR family transcriptional regulator [Oscillospiraceae bacterium]
MTDNKLLSLIRVSETGSFTRAAESLSLTQPAVSQHIRQLENEFGVRIFEHSHNRFHLTREGETLVKYARRVLNAYDRMDQAMRNEREQVFSLTIGITHTAESSTIIEALAGYMRQYDDINLKILTNTTDNLYSMLKNYELDFAFVEGPVRDPSLDSMMLDTDCLVLAVSPDHPLAKEKTVTIDQLKNEKLIMRLPNSNTRSLFSASLESQELSIRDLDVIMEIDSVATIKDLVRRGFGVSVLARSALEEELGRGRLAALAVENLSMVRSISIVFPRDFDRREIISGIVAHYNEMKNR